MSVWPKDNTVKTSNARASGGDERVEQCIAWGVGVGVGVGVGGGVYSAASSGLPSQE